MEILLFLLNLYNPKGFELLTDMADGAAIAHASIARGPYRIPYKHDDFWFTDMRVHIPEASERVSRILRAGW